MEESDFMAEIILFTFVANFDTRISVSYSYRCHMGSVNPENMVLRGSLPLMNSAWWERWVLTCGEPVSCTARAWWLALVVAVPVMAGGLSRCANVPFTPHCQQPRVTSIKHPSISCQGRGHQKGDIDKCILLFRFLSILPGAAWIIMVMSTIWTFRT